MLERYYSFDAERFYSDFYNNKKIMDDLKKERDSLLYTSAIDYSAVRVAGGETNDPTAEIVGRREKIDQRIGEIEDYFKIEKNIYQKLDGSEKYIVDNYLKLTKEERDIVKLSHGLKYSPEWTYRLVKDAKKRIEEIAKWYL